MLLIEPAGFCRVKELALDHGVPSVPSFVSGLVTNTVYSGMLPTAPFSAAPDMLQSTSDRLFQSEPKIRFRSSSMSPMAI